MSNPKLPGPRQAVFDRKGFKLLPRRWVVECTFAWLSRNCRLAKDFERTIESATACLFLASAQLITRKLASHCR